MKVLIASTSATGHLNPLLAIGGILIAEGHKVAGLTGSVFRERIEGIGARFRPLPVGADFDLRDLVSVVPELKNIPPGPERRRVAVERIFVDTIPAQNKGLQEALEDFPADVIIGDDKFFGVLPMLLGPRSKRPPIVLCGTSILPWRSEAGMMHSISQARREKYAVIARKNDRIFNRPVSQRLNQRLGDMGIGPLTMSLFESAVALPDAYLQLTVPSFEFPRNLPPSVNFVGALPIIPNQAPLPPWAPDLDGSRKVALVTQGTVANHDFGVLISPTLAALAEEPDLLVVITTGGRPIDAVPGPIPNNARLASYLPFEWVLPKADVFVTNGGYGSVNQALSFGIPLVTAGLTEDKADVNARVAWSGVGIDLATNEAAPQALREAVRTVLDKPDYRQRALVMANEFAGVDTQSEILRIITNLAHSGPT